MEHRSTHGRRSEIVYMSWEVGSEGLEKWVIVIGLMERAHGEYEGESTAKGLTGLRDSRAAEEKGSADAKGPPSTSSDHTACGEGTPCMRRT